MLSEARRRKRFFTICTVLIALLVVAAPKIFSGTRGTDRMTMYYDNHQQMEQEILRKIPIGSNLQVARKLMSQNGFTKTTETEKSLMFVKEESYWPLDFGTLWTAEIVVSHGKVYGVKVGIEPAD